MLKLTGKNVKIATDTIALPKTEKHNRKINKINKNITEELETKTKHKNTYEKTKNKNKKI